MDATISLITLGRLDLRDAAGREIRPVLQQPKRLALLLYLALGAPRRYQRRDSLLAAFWPGLDSDHARAALRRALYFLRQQLGDDVIVNRAEDEVGVAEERLTCDALEFERRLDAGDLEGALALYRGPLLEGFFVAGAPEAERWLDEQRRRLQDRAAQAAWTLASRTDAPEATAAEWARKAHAIAPDDEAGLRKLMQLLARGGDRAGALRVYDDFARKLAQDLEVEPGEETMRLADSLRGQAPARAPGPPLVPREGPAGVAHRDQSPLLEPVPAATRPAGHAISVEPFTVRGDPSLSYLAEGMRDLVITALDGAGSLRAADAPGAEFVLKGTVVGAGGRLRVSATLGRSGGEVVSRAEAEGAGEAALFDVVDDLVRQLITASIVGPGARLARLAAVTTASLPALKAYLRGEHALRAGRNFDAVQALNEATTLDPAFALAHYRLASAFAATAMILPARGSSDRALEHRARMTDHDRLLLEAQSAWLHGHVAEAERRYGTAVATWPDDVEAWYLLGDLIFHSNPYRGRSIVEAKEPLERVLALEPEHTGALVKLARIAALEKDHPRLEELVARTLAASPTGDQALAMRALRAFALRRADEQFQVMAALPAARSLTVVTAFSDVALYTGDLAMARQIGRDFVTIARADELKALCHLMLAHLAIAMGEVDEAFAELDRAAPLAPSWTREVRGLFASLPFLPLTQERRRAVRDELEAWDPAEARAKVSVPLLLHNGLHSHLRAWVLGLLEARLGNAGGVAAWAEAMAELPVPADAEAAVERMARCLDAERLRLQDRHEEALRTLENARTDVWYQYAIASPFFSGTWDRFLRAALLERTGRQDEAIGWYASIAQRSPWELPFKPDADRAAAALSARNPRGAKAPAAR